MTKFSLFKLPLVIFFLHGESCSSWCCGKFNLFMFYLYIIFFINLKDACVNVMYGNAQVLDEELNLILSGFLGMLFYMLLAFHINLINCKCCIQHTYAFFLLTFLTLWESQCAVDGLWKKISIYIFTNDCY